MPAGARRCSQLPGRPRAELPAALLEQSMDGWLQAGRQNGLVALLLSY